LKPAFRTLRDFFSRRDNEFDNAKPGPSRPLTGLFRHLTEKRKQKALTYRGAEYAGGPKKKAVPGW
jgi:hypothetical protein